MSDRFLVGMLVYVACAVVLTFGFIGCNASKGPSNTGYYQMDNTVTCSDGWISHSGGRQGACSHHGGVR